MDVHQRFVILLHKGIDRINVLFQFCIFTVYNGTKCLNHIPSPNPTLTLLDPNPDLHPNANPDPNPDPNANPLPDKEKNLPLPLAKTSFMFRPLLFLFFVGYIQETAK